MRALNSLTQNLIENLIQLLKQPGQEQDALHTLKICAPVLIEQLQLIQDRAIDRRDVEPQIEEALEEWLKQHPQPDNALQDLLDAMRRHSLLTGAEQKKPA